MKNVEELADKLVKLDVTELNHFTSYIKEKYDLEPQQTIVQTVTSTEKEEETPKYYAMKIVTTGEGKLKIVRELHSISSVGLTIAKAMIDSDKLILLNKSKEEIETAQEAFSAISPGFACEILTSNDPWKED